jgi:hypothetical protein
MKIGPQTLLARGTPYCLLSCARTHVGVGGCPGCPWCFADRTAGRSAFLSKPMDLRFVGLEAPASRSRAGRGALRAFPRSAGLSQLRGYRCRCPLPLDPRAGPISGPPDLQAAALVSGRGAEVVPQSLQVSTSHCRVVWFGPLTACQALSSIVRSGERPNLIRWPHFPRELDEKMMARFFKGRDKCT